MLPLFLFLLSWLVGMGLLFLYLKNSRNTLRIGDVVWTYILSAAVGFVFSFAAWKANISFWLTYIAIAGLAAYITYKFLEKARN